jgi:hypothetical protein
MLSSYIILLFSVQVVTIGISLFQVRISTWLARGVLGLSMAVALIFFFLDKGLLDSLAFPHRLRRWQVPFLVLLGITALTYLILWAAAYMMPDLSYDGNSYHIPTLSMWDVRGYIYWVKTNYLESVINGYPKGAELVSYILVKAFGNSIINAVNLIFLPLGILGIAYLARSLGAGRLLSICAGAALLLIPVNINQSVTTYVDSAYASCAVGCIAILVHLSKTKSPEWKGILIFGAAMGLTICVKSTGIALSCLAMLALLGGWIKDIFFSTPAPVKRPKPPQLAKTTFQRFVFILALLLIALAGGGYWYIRNYVMTGTPLYPVGVTILGQTIFPGISVSEAISEYSNTLTQLKSQSPIVRVLYTWAQGLKAWPVSIKGYDIRDAGLGYLWLFACIPSIGISLFSFPELTPAQKRSFLILVCVTGLAFLTAPMNWWARYTIWIYALGLPCFAFIVTRSVLNQKARIWSRRIASVWMTLCLGLLLFEAAYCAVDVIALASPRQLRSNLMNVFKSSTWVWPTCYLFPDMQGTILEDILTQTGIVAIGPHGDMEFWRYVGLVGQLSQPIGARQLVFISESYDASKQNDLVEGRYIIWDETVPLPPTLELHAKFVTPAAGFLVLSLP